MNKMGDYKFSVKFDDIVLHAMVPFDEDKYLAVASIEQLKEYLPKDVDLDVNRDLLAVAFDAFVVNRGNKNGHIVGTDIALAFVENFINKPFNIEHNRKVVVGVCTGYGFSEFGTSKPLTFEQVKDSKEPFNVVLSGFVWKVVNPDFVAELIDSCDPSSGKYQSVSASWELGFSEFNIARGNKNLSEATIIDKEEEILELKDKLKIFGGNGFDKDGNVLFINLQGNVLPLGIGFTNTPAAEVSGVIVSPTKATASEEEDDEDKDTYSCAKCGFKGVEAETCPKCGSEEYSEIEEDEDEETDASTNETNKKSVLESKENVKQIMQLKNIEDITEDSMKQVAASEVRDFISNRISELATEWKSKVTEKETALSSAEEQINTLKAELETLKSESEKIQGEFAKLQDEIKSKEVEASFQRRMAVLNEEFELSDEDRTLIAEDLNAIDSDEAFEKWLKKFSVLAAAKKKGAKQVEAKASEKKSVEEVVEGAKAKTEVPPNTASVEEQTLIEKISAAFSKNSVKIK